MKEEEILKNAKQLITKYGYKKVSMDEIAKASGVTKKTVYSYFKDKDEILKVFLLKEINNMKEIIKEVEEKNLSFIDTVHQSLYELFKYRRKSDLLTVLANEEVSIRNSNVCERIKVIDESIKEYIKSKLIKAIESKEIWIENPEIASFLIYKMYVALMIEWNGTDENLDENDISNSIVRMLKNGILLGGNESEKYKNI